MKKYLSETQILPIWPFYPLFRKSKALYNKGLFAINKGDVKPNYLDLEKKFKNETKLPWQTRQQILKVLAADFKSYFQSIKSQNVKHRVWKPKYKKKTNMLIFTSQQIGKWNVLLPRDLNYKIKSDKKIQEVKVIPYWKKIKLVISYVIAIDEKLDEKIKELMEESLKKWKFAWIDLWRDRLYSFCDEIWNYSIYKNKSIISKNNYRNYKWSFKKIWRQINDILHKESRKIINNCLKLWVNNLVIGWNDNIKQKSRLKHFVQIPHMRLVEMIKYKWENAWINIIVQEESYTSKIDHFALEEMEHKENYLGKRKKGLFFSSTWKIINADVNGAIWIIRKVAWNSFIQSLNLAKIS